MVFYYPQIISREIISGDSSAVKTLYRQDAKALSPWKRNGHRRNKCPPAHIGM